MGCWILEQRYSDNMGSYVVGKKIGIVLITKRQQESPVNARTRRTCVRVCVTADGKSLSSKHKFCEERRRAVYCITDLCCRIPQWEFQIIDRNDNDKIDQEESDDIISSIRSVEPCIYGFIKSCDYNGDNAIDYREWTGCFPTGGKHTFGQTHNLWCAGANSPNSGIDPKQTDTKRQTETDRQRRTDRQL